MTRTVHAVTGAFGYSGLHLARAPPRARRARPEPHRPPGSPRPVRGRRRGDEVPVRRPRGDARRPAGRPRPLQHVLGPVRSRCVDVRRGGREHARAVPRRGRGRRRARRPRVHHEPLSGLAAALLPREGGGRVGAPRHRALPRHPSARGVLRRPRRPRQQHRLAAPAPSPLRHRAGTVRSPAHPRGGLRPARSRAGLEPRRHGPRRGRSRGARVRGARPARPPRRPVESGASSRSPARCCSRRPASSARSCATSC